MLLIIEKTTTQLLHIVVKLVTELTTLQHRLCFQNQHTITHSLACKFRKTTSSSSERLHGFASLKGITDLLHTILCSTV